ncbi:SGNH/GDSL hydrolase family protein [Natronogracilivirga saccharolytica]|uniref:SGNH/GDSL hydrolase family protein n=1 Tax=Natronogracilivirga saccharolytica TaxID=2812953 RepID=A0A8J7RUJ3_9BACT|nr:GDSL-type esterase/lipase family protein [Natronogracilivirga saccharolytica]MBP3193227.1 SGNH/GDSL hydrolase family protein [Natronogracilivirga saccharolytica]
MSYWKNILFTFAAVMLPFAVLALAEGVLRVTGLESERQELFIPAGDDDTMVVINPAFAGRYFSGFTPDTAPQPFRKDKPEGTRRFFVLGGSSAAGFPYNFYYGFPAKLEEMLQKVHPGEHVEVINLAMTAVNSYTLRDFHRRLAEFDPDGILIYAGHNEYYGAYGAGVVPGWMRPRWVRRSVLSLQDLHLVSLVTRLFRDTGDTDAAWSPDAGDRGAGGTGDGFRRSDDGHDEPAARTLMARMAADRLVRHDEPRFREGIRHFENNISDILSTFQDGEVPVYLSTVVSNKAGQRPLGDDATADSLFAKAKTFNPEQEPDSVRKYFSAARDQDPLRFRAPEDVNQTIRELSRKDGVYLVDAHEISASGGLLPFAPSYFTDHLHLDYRGYALVAEAFGRTIREHGGFRFKKTAHNDSGPVTAQPDPLEEQIVDYTLGLLKSDFPFVRDPEEQKPQKWARQRLEELRASADPASQAALAYITGQVTLADAHARLAGTYRSADQHVSALRSLRALQYLQPLNPDLDRMILDYIAEIADMPDAGSGEEMPASEDEPTTVRATIWQESFPLLVRLKAQSFDERAWPLIVDNLIRSEQFETARYWLESWETLQPDALLYWYFAQWHIRQGQSGEAQPYFREYYRRVR